MSKQDGMAALVDISANLQKAARRYGEDVAAAGVGVKGEEEETT